MAYYASGTKKLTSVVREAFNLLRDKRGATLQAITDYIKKEYKIEEAEIKYLVEHALKAGVKSRLFIQIGDRFKLNYLHRVPVVIQKRRRPKKGIKPTGGIKKAKYKRTTSKPSKKTKKSA